MSSNSYGNAADSAVQATRTGIRAVGETVDRVTDRAADLARQGSEWARDGGQRVRSQIVRASDRTSRNVRDEPVRTVLMVAAAGALIYAIVHMVGGRSDR
jgi:ElaB/YqjD/DUF883 family membrane-anchored ribosome-binding protein